LLFKTDARRIQTPKACEVQTGESDETQSRLSLRNLAEFNLEIDYLVDLSNDSSAYLHAGPAFDMRSLQPCAESLMT